MRIVLSICIALFTALLILSNAESARAVQLVCEEANGLNWCYNPNKCGQACNEVCRSGNMEPIESNEEWFEAQNTEEKCIAISQAFGLGDEVFFGNFTFACLEDMAEPVHGPGINAELSCSMNPVCPERHRTEMDQQGIECSGDPDGEQFARRSICPCEGKFVRPIPTISQWGLIAAAGVLGLAGLYAIRRRRAEA